MRSTFATLAFAVLLTVSAIANAAPTKNGSPSDDNSHLVARDGLTPDLSLANVGPVGDILNKFKGASGGGGSSGGSSGSSSGSSSGGSSGGSSGDSSSGSSDGSSSGSSSSGGSSSIIDPDNKCNSRSGPGLSDGDSCTEHEDDHLRTN
ncbi:hypothetical protein INT45_005162 [Circinella minor]|uniref:Uncharacterized protein n=1 Tax=Circinella minor TaxID=1195481 RepID=A0A8H7RTE3_9FUNG|nr:hypothetical protein INT45_005162 [Circinella minor]